MHNSFPHHRSETARSLRIVVIVTNLLSIRTCLKPPRNSCRTMVQNRKKHRKNRHLKIQFPMSEEMSKVSGASEQLNRRASCPVLQSVFWPTVYRWTGRPDRLGNLTDIRPRPSAQTRHGYLRLSPTMAMTPTMTTLTPTIAITTISTTTTKQRRLKQTRPFWLRPKRWREEIGINETRKSPERNSETTPEKAYETTTTTTTIKTATKTTIATLQSTWKTLMDDNDDEKNQENDDYDDDDA